MRFSLDAQIINLHDKIKQEQAIVSLLRHNEDSYRNLQDRLAIAQQQNSQAQQETKTFFVLLQRIPNTIQINRFDFSKNKLQIDIDTNSTISLGKIIQNLKSQKNVTNINIDKISNTISEGKI